MEAIDVPTVPYSQLANRMGDRLRRQRRPFSGMIEVTHRCNLRCVHCYLDHKVTAPELTREELYQIIDVVVDEGCLWVLFTGGEPFIRPDFLDIYSYAKRKGLMVVLFTNGSLITPRVADCLAELPPYKVSMTLYGAAEETYREVTGSGQFYYDVMRAIDLLMERSIPLELKSMIMTLNRHDFEKMKGFSSKRLGKKLKTDFFITGSISISDEPCKFRLPAEEVAKLKISDKEFVEATRKFCEESLGPPAWSDRLLVCRAGLTSFAIDPYGMLMPCLMFRHGYNLRGDHVRERFHKGFYDFFAELRSKKINHNFKCANCELFNLCHRCPGYAELETGDPEAIIDYACELAHLQVQELA